mgnify:CR=1 FL=1
MQTRHYRAGFAAAQRGAECDPPTSPESAVQEYCAGYHDGYVPPDFIKPAGPDDRADCLL